VSEHTRESAVTDPERTPTPRRRTSRASLRRRAVLITIGCGLVTMAGCLAVNAIAGSPIQWFWLIVAPLYVTALIGAFLWVRLTPSA